MNIWKVIIETCLAVYFLPVVVCLVGIAITYAVRRDRVITGEEEEGWR